MKYSKCWILSLHEILEQKISSIIRCYFYLHKDVFHFKKCRQTEKKETREMTWLTWQTTGIEILADKWEQETSAEFH